MKIIIWGRSHADSAHAHKQKIDDLGAPLILIEGGAKSSASLTGASLIINHDGGIQKPKGAWMIMTSATMSNAPPTDVEKPGKIRWNTFIENLESFFHRVKNRPGITKEDIDTLYAIDPQLEKLLSPFAGANPFEESGEVVENLEKTKAELQAYVENCLRKQDKS